ncbi:hypothetical protein [Thiomonas sp. X19]|uniref:hypothetical protein n=1 Tax=Thiomonas sp. X19 TaxID=1050370 RepID=UPI0011BEC8AD|nr:hypothetical protein [Thiomonas sp. X19]
MSTTKGSAVGMVGSHLNALQTRALVLHSDLQLIGAQRVGAGVGLHLHAPGGQLFASVELHGDVDAQLLPENGVNHGPAQQQGLRQRRREQPASSAGFSQE